MKRLDNKGWGLNEFLLFLLAFFVCLVIVIILCNQLMNKENKKPIIDPIISGDKTDIGDYIELEDFEKLDIRVGKVIECEKVKKSEKLLRFTLKVGSDTRQILSGIAKYHTPEELIGKNVLFVANLKPRKMM